MHERFQELAVMAATGQISGEDRQLLLRHSEACAECRDFMNDLAMMKARVAPVVAASQAKAFYPPAGMRARFLERAAEEGIAIVAGDPMDGGEPIVRRAPERVRQWAPPVWRWVSAAAACVACAMAGYWWSAQGPIEPPPVAAQAAHIPWQIPTPPLVVSPSLQEAALSERIREINEQRAQVQSRLGTLTEELARAKSDGTRLSAELAAASERALAAAKLDQQLKAEAQQIQAADDHIHQLEADLAVERDRRRRAEVASSASLFSTRLNQRIADLEAQLELERNARTGQFAELVSARNLHIVDVYDTASNGLRQRPFGRVFYVEGRSLVFYAYDLANSGRENAKVTFHVWGEQARVKSTTYTLGILKGDGEGQSRWMLTFDDPKVLNRINAVYVTAEASSAPEPRGRKILYAFLGTPNHP